MLAGCANNEVAESDIKDKTEEITEVDSNEESYDEIPEPYTKALSAFNNSDWDLASTYLDLVITDFPDSEYVFPNYTLKSIMKINEYRSVAELISILVSGVDNASSLYVEDDYLTIQRHVDLLKGIVDSTSVELEEIFTYILQNFDLHKGYSAYYHDLSPLTMKNNYNDLSYFENVGYPVPTDLEVEKFLSNHYEAINIQMINEFIEETDNINYQYLPIFFLGINALGENYIEISEELEQVVLSLTAQDRYNEYRVLIERYREDTEGSETDQTEEIVSEQNEDKKGVTDTQEYDPFEWNPGIKEEFEAEMVRRGYVESKDDLIYIDGHIDEENHGYLSVSTILETGEEWFIVLVNVKTGWFHG